MILDNSSQILVVILAIFLVVFLLLAIVLTIFLIRVVQQIQAVTKTAQNAADGINNIIATASKAAVPAMAAQFILRQAKNFMDKRRDTRRKGRK